MSQISKAIIGALAISVAGGAVAFGHDLAGLGTGSSRAASAVPNSGVNRAAKADRDAVKPAPGQTQTVALRLNGLPDTSVLVRMPAAAKAAVKEEAQERTAPSTTKSGGRKAIVACEPVVSVLTEVAKLLQPGRCVT